MYFVDAAQTDHSYYPNVNIQFETAKVRFQPFMLNDVPSFIPTRCSQRERR